MTPLTLDHLKTLAQYSNHPCISIYIPTHRAGTETQQDPIRFKNMLTSAEQELLQLDLKGREVEEFLAPAYSLLDDFFFWNHQYDSLAVFISAEDFHYFRLPYTLEEQLIVSHTYFLKPLLPLFTGNGHYYVLAISQNDVRLFEGTRYSLGQVNLPDHVPGNQEEALRLDDPEKELQFHTGTTAAYGNPRSGMFHGHGPGDEDFKVRLEHYLIILDREIRAFIGQSSTPLVLAGVDYLLPMYHQVSEYPNIMEQGITGNIEHLSAHDIHDSAWAIVEPYFQQEIDDTVEQYHQLQNTERGISDIEGIVYAAYHGRVDKLVIAFDKVQWGKFDPERGVVGNVHDEKQDEGDLSLTDFAAMHTLQNSGTVYALKDEDMPDGLSIFAVLRY